MSKKLDLILVPTDFSGLSCGSFSWATLLAEASDDVKLCPDIGWLHKGGVDLLEFLQSHQARIGAIHFKDFDSLDLDLRDTVVLGDGCVPLKPALAWIGQNMADTWVISEQDFTDLTAEEAIKANALYFEGD